MIEHYATESGGSVKVKSLQGSASVSFSYSNPKDTLSLWCRVQPQSHPHLVDVMIGNLCERFSPCVLAVFSEDTAVRFQPKHRNLYRVWTNRNHSVYSESTSHRNLFSHICSFAGAMQNTDFVKVMWEPHSGNEEILFYENRAVMSWLRERCSPMEFIAEKESCDYSLKRTASDCVEALVDAANESLMWLDSENQAAFGAALDEIYRRQKREDGFDVRYAYIQEFCTAIALPAVVRLGMEHPFTKGIWDSFCRYTSSYLTDCRDLLDDYRAVWDEKRQISENMDGAST
jgi:hypothetical protein